MTLPRSAADVINDHVVFEIESIDWAYCNRYVPKLRRELGVIGFVRQHLGMPAASTAALAERTQVRRFAGQQHVPIVEFTKRQRKDDVMREHLARFLAAGRADGVVRIGGSPWSAPHAASAWSLAAPLAWLLHWHDGMFWWRGRRRPTSANAVIRAHEWRVNMCATWLGRQPTRDTPTPRGT